MTSLSMIFEARQESAARRDGAYASECCRCGEGGRATRGEEHREWSCVPTRRWRLGSLALRDSPAWQQLLGQTGMTNGFACMLVDQAVCTMANGGFFSTALRVEKPPHTNKILRASTFSKVIHRTWERWHNRTMP